MCSYGNVWEAFSWSASSTVEKSIWWAVPTGDLFLQGALTCMSLSGLPTNRRKEEAEEHLQRTWCVYTYRCPQMTIQTNTHTHRDKRRGGVRTHQRRSRPAEVGDDLSAGLIWYEEGVKTLTMVKTSLWSHFWTIQEVSLFSIWWEIFSTSLSRIFL